LFGTEESEGPRKTGLFELAHNGTLYLDEVADMPLETQGKILRVLVDQTFTRVGGTTRVQVDARVICSTTRDLRAEIAAGTFREDLYYRLNVLSINVPPLRERATEIPLLFRHFLQKYSEKFNKEPMVPSQHLLEAALRYPWPGNLRELENFVKRYVILEDDEGSFRELLEMSATRQRISPREEAVPAREQGLKALVRSLKDEAEMEGGRIDVVRRLPEVHVVVGIDVLVFALFVAERLEREVGDHLVRVHVGRRAGAALDHVDHELFVQLSRADLPAGLDDGARTPLVQLPEILVGVRCRLLHARQGIDELRIGADRCPGNRKILQGAQGVNAVVGLGRDLAISQEVVLDAIGVGGHRKLSIVAEHKNPDRQCASNGIEEPSLGHKIRI
jgi:hypothetical protein